MASNRPFGQAGRAVHRLAVAALALLAAACLQQPPAEVVYGAPTVIIPNPPPPPDAAPDAAPLAMPSDQMVTVAAGDSLYAIAQRYGLPISAVIEANDLAPPYTLRIGQRLRLQAASLYQGASASPDSAPPPPPAKPAILTPSALLPATVARPLAPPPPRSQQSFLWPVEGEIVTGFGPLSGGRRNDGINIAAPRGAAVRAAENGVVAYIGNELRGYGNLILIRHADGWVSAYAHNEVVLVGRGDMVERGHIIARVGSSGGVSSPQVHFELRRGVNSVDPIKHLARN